MKASGHSSLPGTVGDFVELKPFVRKHRSARSRPQGRRLHTLRHSAASVMLSERVPVHVVSQILGHAGIAITADVYGHIAPDVS